MPVGETVLFSPHFVIFSLPGSSCSLPQLLRSAHCVFPLVVGVFGCCVKPCAALVLRLKHACYTLVDYTMLLQGPQVLQSSFCGSVSRYGGAIIGIQVCLTSAACIPSQAKCSSFMSLVHCNSIYWTATADICHIQSCRTQGLNFGKRRSSMTRYGARLTA